MGTDTHGLLVAVSWGSGSFVINAAVIVFICTLVLPKTKGRGSAFFCSRSKSTWWRGRSRDLTFPLNPRHRFPMARDANCKCMDERDWESARCHLTIAFADLQCRCFQSWGNSMRSRSLLPRFSGITKENKGPLVRPTNHLLFFSAVKKRKHQKKKYCRVASRDPRCWIWVPSGGVVESAEIFGKLVLVW